METGPTKKIGKQLNPEAIIIGLEPARNERVEMHRGIGRDNQLNFSSYSIQYLSLDDLNGEKLVYLKDLVVGKPIVDFGAGKDTDAYKLACLLGASAYVAVEPFSSESLVHNIEEVAKEKISFRLRRKDGDRMKFEDFEVDPIDFSVVPEDALTFAKRIPDSSVNAFSFGTDECIIKDSQYIDSVREEISRILPSGGVFICENTVFTPFSFKDKVVRKDNENSSRDYGIKIYKVD